MFYLSRDSGNDVGQYSANSLPDLGEHVGLDIALRLWYHSVMKLNVIAKAEVRVNREEPVHCGICRNEIGHQDKFVKFHVVGPFPLELYADFLRRFELDKIGEVRMIICDKCIAIYELNE